ncbi:hypothetical protein Peur_004603 [Populus x canadensis]
MYILCRRLKLLKRPLKQLNKLYFGHISERVHRIETELEHHQSLLHDHRDDAQLLAQDHELSLELVNLKSLEKVFYSQKLKCDFLKDSDRGTSFFHAWMNQKHKANFILAIHRSDGSLTTSASEVGEVFVNFFQQLLGTSRATSPLDESVVRCGPCVDSSLHSSLLAHVSSNDIKKALFSIGDTKSPGPDGNSVFFFKKS